MTALKDCECTKQLRRFWTSSRMTTLKGRGRRSVRRGGSAGPGGRRQRRVGRGPDVAPGGGRLGGGDERVGEQGGGGGVDAGEGEGGQVAVVGGDGLNRLERDGDGLERVGGRELGEVVDVGVGEDGEADGGGGGRERAGEVVLEERDRVASFDAAEEVDAGRNVGHDPDLLAGLEGLELEGEPGGFGFGGRGVVGAGAGPVVGGEEDIVEDDEARVRQGSQRDVVAAGGLPGAVRGELAGEIGGGRGGGIAGGGGCGERRGATEEFVVGIEVVVAAGGVVVAESVIDGGVGKGVA